jgi:subtilisin family serine protease
VRLPYGVDAASVGLAPFVPGFGRVRGTADNLLAFADGHPDLALEVAPPPHLLLNMVGEWTHAVQARETYGLYGDGVAIGIVDTGVDFSLADFMDPLTGHTRIAWLLDLDITDAPQNPAYQTNAEISSLEARFQGFVYRGIDLDDMLASGTPMSGITDTVGHGTHVASIAAGNGGVAKKYVGIAPRADLIIARITTDDSEGLTTDGLLTGAEFVFDRADAMREPVVANLSIGSDFGPHDGTMAWEESLAEFVGPTHPGHAIVAAAGNSGDITSAGVHANVYVPPGGSRSIPITSLYGSGSDGYAEIEVWVTMRGDSQLSIGLDSPSGTWISPVGPGQSGTFDAGSVQATVESGSAGSAGQVPTNSNGALVLWQGTFDPGTYSITLTSAGGGVADLYVEGAGGAIDVDGNGVAFANPVREGTVNLPATNPGIIGVGCTVNRAGWTDIAGGYVTVGISPLDPRGGYAIPDAGTFSYPETGNVCWFSSAGPTVTGVEKPEISAPGGIVIGAMSQAASPAVPTSIFYNSACPPVYDGGPVDSRCMQVDATHAVAAGTSMSAPQAAGAIALLFEKEPTLTQDKLVGLLQAGAHMFRTGTPRFDDQGGPGELDVAGSLDALDQAQNPANVLPNLATSWITLSAEQLSADGSTPLTAIVELRTADGQHRGDFFDASRLSPVVRLDDGEIATLPPMTHRAPGVWVYTITAPPGLGGHTVTLGATFDGEPIVAPKTVPIATDVWTASYPASASGSCAIGRSSPLGWSGPSALAFAAAAYLGRRRVTRRRPRRASHEALFGSRPGRGEARGRGDLQRCSRR